MKRKATDTSASSPDLRIGDRVKIELPHHRAYNEPGVITEIEFRYTVRCDSGPGDRFVVGLYAHDLIRLDEPEKEA